MSRDAVSPDHRGLRAVLVATATLLLIDGLFSLFVARIPLQPFAYLWRHATTTMVGQLSPFIVLALLTFVVATLVAPGRPSPRTLGRVLIIAGVVLLMAELLYAWDTFRLRSGLPSDQQNRFLGISLRTFWQLPIAALVLFFAARVSFAVSPQASTAATASRA